MSSPEKVIEAIRNSFIGASQVYTNGSCIMFYFFLKTIYPKALPYWSKEERHMITKIGNKYYDINGVVTNTAGYELDSEKYSSFPIAVAFPARREKRVRYANAKKNVLMSNKRCIISLANERGNYQLALDRLEASVKQHNPEIDFFGYRSEDEVGAPKHLDNPYAFKVYAISKAKDAGYTSVLWLDSSCYLICDITPLFELIERDGYAMQEAGAFVGDWCNDETLQYFGISRDIALKILMYGNAGLLGLDFNSVNSHLFFIDWTDSMLAGCFKGDWDNHRHDMTCGSIIANRLNMAYNIKGDEILEYAAPEAPKKNDTIIIKAQGI